jgi:hypothetical protein
MMRELASDPECFQIFQDILAPGPVLESLKIAMEAGAHTRITLDHTDAPTGSRQGNRRG